MAVMNPLGSRNIIIIDDNYIGVVFTGIYGGGKTDR